MLHQRVSQSSAAERTRQHTADVCMKRPPAARTPVHPVLQLQQAIGNRGVQRVIMAKAISGGSCESAATRSGEDDREQATVGRLHISRADANASRIQRYSLNGFPPAKEAAMHTAIRDALRTVKSCSSASWWAKRVVPPAIAMKRYDYVEDLGMCGWTFPASWYIEIGKDAFDRSKCCDLASTVAHEASHTEFYTEGNARELECDCFSCSC
jgi:hypothetical protein